MVEPDSPLRGMAALQERIRKRQEHRLILAEKIGVQVTRITGRNIFDSDQQEDVSPVLSEWRGRVQEARETDEVAAFIERDGLDGNPRRVIASYGSLFGLRIAGERVELEVKGEIDEKEMSRAFKRALRNPETVRE